MKALTLHRPWDELILRHGKDVENRGWTTSHRGRLLIHAGKSWDLRAIHAAGIDHGIPLDVTPDAQPVGLRGTVVVLDVCAKAVDDFRLNLSGDPVCGCGPWAMPGEYHWRLADPRPFDVPIPCRGLQQLWTPPAEVLAQVEAVIGR